MWAPRAQAERMEILSYWRERTGSSAYSIKLNGLFKEAIEAIRAYPDTWQKTDIPGVRLKRVREYEIYYLERKNEIMILSLWDGRRDPESFYL